MASSSAAARMSRQEYDAAVDEQLDSMSDGLSRVKVIGETIHSTLRSQQEGLRHLDDELAEANVSVKVSNSKMSVLLKRGKACCGPQCACLTLLAVVILILLALVVS
jgi:hypothetical protein